MTSFPEPRFPRPGNGGAPSVPPSTARALAQAMAIRGPYSPVLEEAVVPTLIVGDLTTALSLTSQRKFLKASGAVGDAGDFAQMGIHNPIDSGVIVRVTKWVVSTDTTQTLQLLTGLAMPGTVVEEFVHILDTRQGDWEGSSVLQYSVDSTVATGRNLLQIRLLANTPFTVKTDFVLNAGETVRWKTLTAATALHVAMFGEELSQQDIQVGS